MFFSTPPLAPPNCPFLPWWQRLLLPLLPPVLHPFFCYRQGVVFGFLTSWARFLYSSSSEDENESSDLLQLVFEKGSFWRDAMGWSSLSNEMDPAEEDESDDIWYMWVGEETKLVVTFCLWLKMSAMKRAWTAGKIYFFLKFCNCQFINGVAGRKSMGKGRKIHHNSMDDVILLVISENEILMKMGWKGV